MISKLSSTFLICRKPLKLFRYASKLSYVHHVGQNALRPITIGHLLEEAVHDHGDDLAVISRHQNKIMTFLDILKEADRVAAGLIKLGFQYGDRVGIWAPNIAEWYAAYMACARVGFVMVALNPANQPKEIEYCIRKVGIKGIICIHEHKKQNYYEILNVVCPELEHCEPGKLKSSNLPSLKNIIIVGDKILQGTHNYEQVKDVADENTIRAIRKNQNDIRSDDPSVIMFTSGTTGAPKATVVSQFGLINNGYFTGKRNLLGMKRHTICLQVPFFHVFGLLCGIMGSLNFGTTLVLPTMGFDADKSLDALAQDHCTYIFGTPTMFVDLVRVQKERKETLSCEIALSAGAPCSPHLFNEMLEVLGLEKVKSAYGLSELSAVAFQTLVDDDKYKALTTVGYLHEHMEAKVVDEKGTIVPVGTPGELWLRSYSTMLGYWGDEEQTKKMITSSRWLKTGDQFILDENGYGRVVGRIKEMIIRGGENIFPKEIEDILNTHPSILESYVIGLPHERLGEEVCACVRVTENSTLTLEDVKQFCTGKLSYFKIPSVLEIMEHFPKTESGKIRKFQLTEMVKNKQQECI